MRRDVTSINREQTRKQRILIADDSEMNRSILVMELSSRGMTWRSWYLGFRVMTWTPWVVRVVLGERRAVLKIRALGSVEYRASSRSSVRCSRAARGLLMPPERV